MAPSIRSFGLACALAGGLVCGAPAPGFTEAAAPVDTLYYNGPIYTMTETSEEAADARNARTVEVVAARGGRIAYVGTEAEARKRGYFSTARRLVDLKGKTLLPGFVDGHGHFPEQGQYDLYEINLNSRPLGAMSSIADYQRELRSRCKDAVPGEWIVGWGYDDTSITDQRHPTRQDIDAVCPDNPVYLRHISGHMGVAGSQALERAGITPARPEKLHTEGVVKDKEGRPTGLLMETKAMGLITSLPDFPRPDPRKSLARANHVYAAAGVTTADQGASMLATHLPLFQNGLADKDLSLRVVLHPMAAYEQALPGAGVIDVAGWMNRAALGWKDTGASRHAGDGVPLFDDAASAVKTGEDITRRGTAVYGIDPHTGTGFKETDIPAPEGLPSERLFLGAWKLLFDGSPQGYTAWLKAPGYYNGGTYTAADSFDGAPYFDGARGTLNISPAQLEQLLHLYHRAGQSTETHINGNAAAEAWITALEKAVTASPEVEDTRHTAIHAQMLELQHIRRMTGNYAELEGTGHLSTGLTGAFKDGRINPAEVGASDIASLAGLMKKQHLFNSYFIDHVYFWGDRHRNIFMGPGRAANMSPVGWSVHYGQPYSFHSDTFVTPIHPLRSVQTAVTRTTASTPLSPGGTLISGTGKDIDAIAEYPVRDPAKAGGTVKTGLFPDYDQRINALQALHGVTRLPAWQNKLENRLGSLREGLAADFVILEKDPLRVAAADAHTLADIRVMATVVGDHVVYGFLPGSHELASPPIPAYVWNAGMDVTVRDAVPLITAGKNAVPLPNGETLLGAYSFEAEVRGGNTAAFQMDVLGNGGPASDMRLYRVTGPDRAVPFTYAVDNPPRGGSFWIAPLDDPTGKVRPDAILHMDRTYIVFFVLDTDAPPDGRAAGRLAASVLLTTTGPLPGNGGTTPAGESRKTSLGAGASASHGSLLQRRH